MRCCRRRCWCAPKSSTAPPSYTIGATELGLKGRLDNPNFVKSAPEDVIIEARANLEAREDEAAKVSAAIARLAEIG